MTQVRPGFLIALLFVVAAVGVYAGLELADRPSDATSSPTVTAVTGPTVALPATATTVHYDPRGTAAPATKWYGQVPQFCTLYAVNGPKAGEVLVRNIVGTDFEQVETWIIEQCPTAVYPNGTGNP